MPVVTGKLTDFGLDPMLDNAPRIVFTYTSPGISRSSILATHPVVAEPLYNGYFEAELVDTASISPAGYYIVSLEWRDDKTRVYRRDVLPGELYVPAAGGILADLLRIPVNPALVWSGAEPPRDPSPGSWWQTPNGDIFEWSGNSWNFKNNIRGPAGYNATGAAEDALALAAFVGDTAGANAFSAALRKFYVRRGDLVTAVNDYLPAGYKPGITDIKPAFDAAVAAAAPGSIVQFTAGEDYFLTYGEPITKPLTIDLNMCRLTVDPTPGTGSKGRSPIFFTGELSPLVHTFTAVQAGAISVTLPSAAAAAAYARGDYVRISDQKVMLPWDAGIPGNTATYPNGWTGREELGTVRRVEGAVVTLDKPLEWDYSVSPTIQRISNMLQAPRVVNAVRIHEIDPGSANESGSAGRDMPHLVQFNYCYSPLAQNLHFHGWNLHALNFTRCINPQAHWNTGIDPYRPEIGGHGYLIRMGYTIGGSSTHNYTERVRHHIDYVMSFDGSSSDNLAVSHVSAAYAWHGYGSARCSSDNDKAVDTGGAWGWMVGNGAFAGDYDIKISNPSYSGTNIAIMFQAASRNLTIVSPDVRTTTRAVQMLTGAGGLYIEGGSLAVLGNSPNSNPVLARPQTGANDTYGRPVGDLRIEGTRMIGANPVLSLNTAGAVELINLKFLDADQRKIGQNINLLQFAGRPASLRVDGCTFAGVYSSALHYTQTPPAGQYAITNNYVAGHTERAMTLPVAPNLRFIDNEHVDNGKPFDQWVLNGDVAGAINGNARGYGAIVAGNRPATFDELTGNRLTLNGAIGTARQLIFRSGALTRWIMRTTATEEPGGNVGTDLEIIARTDTGGPGPVVFSARRSGDVSLGTGGRRLGFYGSAGAPKPIVTGSRAGETEAARSLREALVSLDLIGDTTTP